MTVQRGLIEYAQDEREAALAALGFAPPQIARLLVQGVTVEQLRGMLQLKRCEGAPAAVLTEIAERIDRVAELEELMLDSHTA